MQIINTHEAKTHLSRLLDDVLKGKEIIIGKAGEPIAKLVPYEKPKVKRVGGQLSGKIQLKRDFEKLPSDFLSFFAK